MTDIDAFLKGGTSVPSFKFRTIGDTVKGTVVDREVRQAIDFDTQAPAFWPDGKEKLNLVVTLQTDLRDPEVTDDDGQRRIYAMKPSSMLTAIGEAVGDGSLEVGGTLAVQFSGEEPAKRGNPRKLYRAQYQPPSTTAVADLLGSDAPPATTSAADLL